MFLYTKTYNKFILNNKYFIVEINVILFKFKFLLINYFLYIFILYILFNN